MPGIRSPVYGSLRELVTVEHYLDTMLCGSSPERQQTIDLLLSDRKRFPKEAA